MRIRPVAALVAALTLAAGAAGCSTRPPADEIYLYYTAGSVDTKKFQECVPPNTKGPWKANNQTFALPTSLRTWNIRHGGGGDTDQPIRSGTLPTPAAEGKAAQPGPEINVYATAEFYLNTFCGADNKDPNSPVVQFWERTGRRYAADTPGGWRTMLLNTFVPSEEKAVREVTRYYAPDDLDANTNGVWRKAEARLGPIFLAELKAKTGGDYFCGPEYRGGAPVTWTEPNPDPALPAVTKQGPCPPVRISITDVTFADAGIAESRAKVFKAEQDAKAALIAAQSQVNVANKLAEATANPDYLKLKELETWLAGIQACAANPNCTTFVGQPGGVVVGR